MQGALKGASASPSDPPDGRDAPNRLRLSGTYFELTDRFPPRTGAAAVSPEVGDRVVVISVPKRVVPLAVRRNTVKRIVRESWRAAGGAESGPGRACLVRLKRYPTLQPTVQPIPGFLAIKRQLRADVDRLFAALLQGRPGPTRLTRGGMR